MESPIVNIGDGWGVIELMSINIYSLRDSCKIAFTNRLLQESISLLTPMIDCYPALSESTELYLGNKPCIVLDEHWPGIKLSICKFGSSAIAFIGIWKEIFIKTLDPFRFIDTGIRSTHWTWLPILTGLGETMLRKGSVVFYLCVW